VTGETVLPASGYYPHRLARRDRCCIDTLARHSTLLVEAVRTSMTSSLESVASSVILSVIAKRKTATNGKRAQTPAKAQSRQQAELEEFGSGPRTNARCDKSSNRTPTLSASLSMGFSPAARQILAGSEDCRADGGGDACAKNMIASSRMLADGQE
jgi:hypothetical protein